MDSNNSKIFYMGFHKIYETHLYPLPNKQTHTFTRKILITAPLTRSYTFLSHLPNMEVCKHTNPFHFEMLCANPLLQQKRFKATRCVPTQRRRNRDFKLKILPVTDISSFCISRISGSSSKTILACFVSFLFFSFDDDDLR